MEDSPDFTRKKFFTKAEVIRKLTEKNYVIKEVCEEVTEELCPFDINDEDGEDIEEKLEKLKKVTKILTAKVSRLASDFRKRKFRHIPDALEEKEISCSQYSIFQSQPGDSESLIGSQDQDMSDNDIEEMDQTRPTSYQKKPLDSAMNKKSRSRRVFDKRDTFNDWAIDEGVSVTKLLGYFLYLENYHDGDRNLASAGWKIFCGDKLNGLHEASVEEATWIIERAGMSQAVYLEMRLRFLDRFVFPPVMHVSKESKTHRPNLTEYKNGAMASLGQCLSLTLGERLVVMDLSSINLNSVNIEYKFTWGLDGSGDHSDFKQMSKVTYTTKQVMSVCYSIKEVKVTDNMGDMVTWYSSEQGANCPQNIRPLGIFPAKEDKELLRDVIPKIECEVARIKAEGITVVVDGNDYVATCKGALLTMVDGKMVTSLLQLEGAYCTMCSKGQLECHNSDVIKSGFLIDRSVDNVRELALSLCDPDTGEIIKKKGDYSVRQGVCDKPITDSDVTKNIPVCHAKIRSFEWFIELLVRYLSHMKWYSTSKPVKITTEDKESYKVARDRVKCELYQKLAVNIGNPGEMVTGAAFAAFSSDHATDVITSLVADDYKDSFKFIHLGLCAVVKVINSQKRRVNTVELREISQSVLLKIVESFPWAVISPSVHRILSHGWERIQLNDGFGLGNISEEGLEALNKWIRRLRVSGSRTVSTVLNFTDTFNHLWDRSRPVIVDMERQIKRKNPKIIVGTEIDNLVLSLFLEDESD